MDTFPILYTIWFRKYFGSLIWGRKEGSCFLFDYVPIGVCDYVADGALVGREPTTLYNAPLRCGCAAIGARSGYVGIYASRGCLINIREQTITFLLIFAVALKLRSEQTFFIIELEQQVNEQHQPDRQSNP